MNMPLKVMLENAAQVDVLKKVHDPLYKIDTKGKVRVWFMEQHGANHRTIAGIKDGNLVTSEWTLCETTNAGRTNERNPVQQATFEIEAEYEKKLTREYHRSVEAAGGGAHFFKPMLAQEYETFAPGYSQPKLDGIRCIAKADGLWSRQGKPILGAPHIIAALKPVFEAAPDLILDGELYNHELKDDFNTIVSLVKKQKPNEEEIAKAADLVQYHVYDAPSLPQPFYERLTNAWALLDEYEDAGRIVFVDTHPVNTAADYDELHGRWLEQGFEGSIWRADAAYEQKRSKHLRKRKEFVDEEFEVIRIEEGLGNWSGVAKRVVCRLPDGREFGAGIKGSRERAAELLHERHKVVTIKYFARTPDGIPRFPVAIKFHGEEREL